MSVVCRQDSSGVLWELKDRVVLQTSVCELSVSNCTDRVGPTNPQLRIRVVQDRVSGPTSKSLAETRTEWSETERSSKQELA